MRWFWTAVTAFAIVACDGARQPEASDVRADEEAVVQVLEDVLDRFEAGDVDGLMSHYADDAVWMLPELREDVDKEKARAYYAELFENVDPRGYTARRSVEVSGDWAFARITYQGELHPKAGGEPRQGYSRHLTVLRRGPGGAWKIYWDIFNLPS